MPGFWQPLADRLNAGENAFLAVVAAHRKGSPGTAGAKLFVSSRGDAVGTIGGGRMELELIERGRAVLREGSFPTSIRTLHHRRSGIGEKSGLICSGQQTNVYHLCRPEADAQVASTIAASLAADHPGLLSLDARGLHFAPGVSDPQTFGCTLIEAGEQWCYREQILNPRRIVVAGGGHCGSALAGIMAGLGYVVTVLDERADAPVTGNDRAGARILRVADYGEAVARIDHPELTVVVVMTSEYASDVRALEGALDRPFPFIGVMGSSAKLAEIERTLRARGHGPRELARLRAPVGLPIGSHTPGEIAISVAAQVIQHESARRTASEDA